MNTIKIALCTLMLSVACGATATPISCDASIANNVSANAGCQLGSSNNDFLNPLQVNLDQLFGYDDWMFGQKVIDSDMNIDLGLSLPGDTISGTWLIDDIWSVYSDAMLVFKSGAGNNTVPFYVSYLLNPGDLSGSYMTPFANANNLNPKSISHVSIYVRGTANQISEPSILGLLGLGLALISFRLRQRR